LIDHKYRFNTYGGLHTIWAARKAKEAYEKKESALEEPDNLTNDGKDFKQSFSYFQIHPKNMPSF